MSAGVERALARVRAQVAARIAAVPGVVAVVEGDRVVASGWRLKARWLNDPRLRWVMR